MKSTVLPVAFCAFFTLYGMNCAAGPSRIVIGASSGTVTEESTITIDVIDTGGLNIDYFTFEHNGRSKTDCPGAGAPSRCNWSVARADNGIHTWQVMAYDMEGNTWPSNVIDVDVQIAGSRGGLPIPTTLSGAELTGFVQSAGTARDIVVKTDALSRDLAYVGSDEFGLGIFDVSDPSQPVALGAVRPTFKGGLGVAVDDTLAVVGSGSGGMYVVDVSDPTQPQKVGHLAGSIEGVAISGNVAYARIGVPGNPAHSDLIVVDLSAPESPAIVDQIFLPSGNQVEVSGSHLYVTTGGGLQIFDIGNPLSPQARGSRAVANGARELAVAGDYAYVGNLSLIQAVNISNPSNPVPAGSVGVATFGLAVSGGRLYSIGGGLTTIDVSNPEAPTVLSSVHDYFAQGVAAIGTVAVLTSPEIDVVDDAGGMHLFDVSVPTGPIQVGHVPGAFGGNFGVAVSDSLAVTASGSAGMHVVDVSDETDPRPIGWLGGNVRGVALSGEHAYLRVAVPGNPAHTDLVVVSLHDPRSPAVLRTIYLPGGDAIVVEGDRLYASNGAGFEIYDIGNAASPASIGSTTVPGGALVMAVSGDFVYAGNYDSTYVIDASNAAGPSLLGSVSGLSFGLAAQGTMLYAVGGGLRVIDVSNPSAPAVVSTANDYGASGLHVVGNLVFAASPNRNDADLYVFDITDATAPELLDRMAIPGPGRRVTGTSTHVYVGDESALVNVVRLQ